MKNKIAFFPYGISEKNPYQKLLKEAVESDSDKTFKVLKWPGNKWFPYIKLFFKKAYIIHHFWPHDFYKGRNSLSALLKQISFQLSLPFLINRKLVYSVENLVSHEFTDFNFEVKMIQKLINKSDGLIFMTNASKDLFLNHYKTPPNCKILILPHISYTDQYKNTLSTKESRDLLNLKENDRVILSLGRVDKYKGIIELIHSFSLSAGKNDVLLIAGKCSNKKYANEINMSIRNISKNGIRVVFINKFIDDDELQVFFNSSDAAVINYKDTPMNPGSLIMAMGFGCTIIAPNLESISEIVPHESYFGFKQNDTLSFNNAIKSFIETENINYKSELCRNRILSNHNKKIINQKIISFYNEIK